MHATHSIRPPGFGTGQGRVPYAPRAADTCASDLGVKPRLFTPGAVKAEQVAARLLVGRLAQKRDPRSGEATLRCHCAAKRRPAAVARKRSMPELKVPALAAVSAVVRRGRRASGGPGEQLRPPAPWEASTELSTACANSFFCLHYSACSVVGGATRDGPARREGWSGAARAALTTMAPSHGRTGGWGERGASRRPKSPRGVARRARCLRVSEEYGRRLRLSRPHAYTC